MRLPMFVKRMIQDEKGQVLPLVLVFLPVSYTHLTLPTSDLV